MACDCISRVEKLVKAQTNESGCLDTSIGVRYNEPADNFWDCMCPKDFYDNLKKDCDTKDAF